MPRCRCSRSAIIPHGLAEYEWRWKRAGYAPRTDLRKPLWLGETPLAGRTILLHAEQGLGDTVMLSRYAPLLARSGATVVMEVQPELKGLLAGLDGVAAVVGHGEPLPPFDLHCPLTSLPFACKTELAGVPAEIPYLRADPARIEKWRPRLDGAAAARRARLVGPFEPRQRPQPLAVAVAAFAAA